jgi:hypothetical protein
MQANMLGRIFRRIDTSGDGKLGREELDDFFKQVAGGKDHFTAADLRRAMIPRGPTGFNPGDGPSIPVLVRGLFAGEIGSIAEGPKLGETAPDFSLRTVDGAETVTLSKLVGPRPLVLIFGNFTCGPFRGLYPDLDAIYRRHRGNAAFLMVYVREAHPSDGWVTESKTRVGVKVARPTTLGERTKVCDRFCRLLKPSMPVVVDDVTDPAGTAYSGMPGRLYVIDPKGKVAYKSGRGPFGFKAGELEQALVMGLLETSMRDVVSGSGPASIRAQAGSGCGSPAAPGNRFQASPVARTGNRGGSGPVVPSAGGTAKRIGSQKVYTMTNP